MFNNKKKRNIHNRVMEVIETKIAEAQKKHDIRVTELTEECNRAIQELDAKLENDKTMLEDSIVQDIIGKVI